LGVNVSGRRCFPRFNCRSSATSIYRRLVFQRGLKTTNFAHVCCANFKRPISWPSLMHHRSFSAEAARLQVALPAEASQESLFHMCPPSKLSSKLSSGAWSSALKMKSRHDDVMKRLNSSTDPREISALSIEVGRLQVKRSLITSLHKIPKLMKFLGNE